MCGVNIWVFLLVVAAASEEFVSDLSSGNNGRLCAVHGKPVEIGVGISGETLLVDIGHCQHKNGKGSARTDTQKNFDEHLKEFGDAGIVKFFSDYENQNLCNGSCIPSKMRHERHTTRTGLIEIPVVTDCVCATLDSYCRKEEKLSTFHPGTPFEATIDVGSCYGGCGENRKSSCKPIRNRTLAVEGPNGFSSESIIEECACGSSCYRSSKFEHIFDYSNVLDSNGTRMANVAPDVKIIDIGDCSGDCNGETEKKCAIWSTDLPNSGKPQSIPTAYQLYVPPGPKKCLAYLNTRQKKCAPVEYAANIYTDRYGIERIAISIASCGCH